jgi:hypothetical protein
MDRPLKPGEWIDDLPEPLETVEDVRDLFERVKQVKAQLRKEAIERANRN